MAPKAFNVSSVHVSLEVGVKNRHAFQGYGDNVDAEFGPLAAILDRLAVVLKAPIWFKLGFPSRNSTSSRQYSLCSRKAGARNVRVWRELQLHANTAIAMLLWLLQFGVLCPWLRESIFFMACPIIGVCRPIHLSNWRHGLYSWCMSPTYDKIPEKLSCVRALERPATLRNQD